MSDSTYWDRFDEVVTSADDLEEFVGEPLPIVLDKVIDHVDDIAREFIARSPFCLVATASTSGHIDISPKGDPPGFVHVLDDRHLAIPDRPGNRRADSFHNLLTDDRIGLIFLAPGKTETLRVSGRARVVRDRALLESMAVQERSPSLAVVVEVERVMVHCPKCMIRSKLWKPDRWPDVADLADVGEALIAHSDAAITPEELHEQVVNGGHADLY